MKYIWGIICIILAILTLAGIAASAETGDYGIVLFFIAITIFFGWLTRKSSVKGKIKEEQQFEKKQKCIPDSKEFNKIVDNFFLYPLNNR